MLAYKKIPKSNRMMAAILLLLVYMALAMADLFISFFGGIVLGALLFQFYLEARLFFKKKKTKSSRRGPR